MVVNVAGPYMLAEGEAWERCTWTLCPDVSFRASAGSRGCLHLVQSALRGRQHGGDQTVEAMSWRDAWS